MTDLTTEYLGLKLANPLVPSSSPLSRDFDSAKELEDAGAAAIVMHSLFEEEIHHEQEHLQRFMHHQSIGHAEAEDFHPAPGNINCCLDNYLEQLTRLKTGLDIPIIASLNGISFDGWVRHGKDLQAAGADALELNVYYIPTRIDETSQQVEQRYIDLLTELKQHVSIPITMKLSPQFSAIGHFVHTLQQAGADGISLFNRFYQPDIDLETLQVKPQLHMSSSIESLLRIRWIAILHGQVDLSIAATGGIHTVEDVLKALLAGADITHLCSELLQHGSARISEIIQQLHHWLEQHEYESVQQLKGSISMQHAIDPASYVRANYLDVIDSYSPAPGVLR